MKIKMQRYNIVENADLLEKYFFEDEEKEKETICLPLKLNYAINRNRMTLMRLKKDFWEARNIIIKKYGKPSEQDLNQYYIEKERDIQLAQNEFSDFMEGFEEVDLYIIDIDELPSDLKLTSAQMHTLLFMISEKKEVDLCLKNN